jgi:LmbE family N-acetylglucosaminyl deacetylase
MRRRTLLFLLLAALPATAEPGGRILVVTSNGAGWMVGAGGTLAQHVLDGYEVTVAQFGNDEKESAGLNQAETRWANVQEAKAAAEYLGVLDWVRMDFKSGETGHVSQTEMRKQLFALIRWLKPVKLFIPDPYVHYHGDWDNYFVGRMAEEAWGYSGGSTFGTELERIGLAPYSAPEVYYYAAGRPYRPREGGEGAARLEAVDISSHMDAKLYALAMLRTRNQQTARATRIRLDNAGRSVEALPPLDEKGIQSLVQAGARELATEIGAKHGLGYAEEFNYVGRGAAIPPHALERAVKKGGAR